MPGAGTWSARVSLATDIEQALAYLNARLEKADYDRDAKVLIWKHEGHSYAFRPREIKSAPARDRGFVACMAFAVALREGRMELSCCPVLNEPAYHASWASLLELLGTFGA